MTRGVAAGFLVGFAVILAGCVSEPVTKPREPLPRDACNDKLNQWAECVLRFYVVNRRLPETPEELVASGRGQQPRVDLVCPLSQQRYVFEPQGLRSPGLDGRVILHDVAGAHAGFCWGLIIQAPAGNQPLTTRVIALAEN